MAFGSQVLNFTPKELEQADRLPYVLSRWQFAHSRTALLYALGYETELRKDGWIPNEETPEKVAELFAMSATQQTPEDLPRPAIFNEPEPQTYLTKVLGIQVQVHHQGSETSILAAEAVIGSVEALFATGHDLNALPHTESFALSIEEVANLAEPAFTIHEEQMTATVRWPENKLPAAYEHQVEVQNMLIHLSASIFAATCFVRDMAATLERFFADEAVLDRFAMVVAVGNSRRRAFNDSVGRVSRWTRDADTAYAIQASRPAIVRRNLDIASIEDESDTPSACDGGHRTLPTDHRDISVRSLIDMGLWNRAGWTGTAFTWEPNAPPHLALVFTNAEAARKIFERWRERFGAVDKDNDIYVAVVRGISADMPSHYRVIITSRIRTDVEPDRRQHLLILSRIQTMQAASDANLNRFLEAYKRAGEYLLIPSVLNGNQRPQLFVDLAVTKSALTVKMASDVRENDIEVIALSPEADHSPTRRSPTES